MILEEAHEWLYELDGGMYVNVLTEEANKSKNEYIYKTPVLKLVV